MIKEQKCNDKTFFRVSMFLISLNMFFATVKDQSEVFLSKADGLPQDCAVNCDHLQTVSKVKIGQLIISLPPSKMIDVGRAISFALDI